MMMRPVSCWLVGCWLGFMGASAYSGVTPLVQVPRHLVPVQIPYAPPPEPEFPEIEKATPGPTELTEAELKRAEALLPLLEGRQELYVIGEFVHLGKPVVPILVKALTCPAPGFDTMPLKRSLLLKTRKLFRICSNPQRIRRK